MSEVVAFDISRTLPFNASAKKIHISKVRPLKCKFSCDALYYAVQQGSHFSLWMKS